MSTHLQVRPIRFPSYKLPAVLGWLARLANVISPEAFGCGLAVHLLATRQALEAVLTVDDSSWKSQFFIRQTAHGLRLGGPPASLLTCGEDELFEACRSALAHGSARNLRAELTYLKACAVFVALSDGTTGSYRSRASSVFDGWITQVAARTARRHEGYDEVFRGINPEASKYGIAASEYGLRMTDYSIHLSPAPDASQQGKVFARLVGETGDPVTESVGAEIYSATVESVGAAAVYVAGEARRS